MQTWKRIVLWIIVAALVVSVAVCQKKTEKAKTAGAPEKTEISSAPGEETKPAEEQPAAEEGEKAEEEPSVAEKPEAAEPEKPAEAAPAEPAKEITRDNAAAIIEMAKGGRIVIDFYPEDAPNTVDNFIKLAKKSFYDGLTFHRVIPGFVAQGGRPRGSPTPSIKAELNSRKHLKGTVAMARLPDDYDSATSQFYICLEPQPGLDGEYTVFGQVIEGMDVVDGINVGDVMKKVTVVDKASLEK